MSAGLRIYIAGPMRGIPEYNFPAFFAAEKYLRSFSRVTDVFNPARHDEDNGYEWRGKTGVEDDGFDLRAALGTDLNYISLYADAVLLLPGWENSKGARAELATAQALGLQAAEWFVNPADYDERLMYDFVTLRPASEIQPRLPLAPPATPPTDPREKFGLRADAKVLENGVIKTAFPDKIRANGEVRVVDPVTGGEKGSKPERFDLIPVGALREVARVYGFGAQKYADNNWRKGYAWHLSYAALLRHVTSFWDGEDLDPESGLPHLAHTAWQALTLLQFQLDNLGTDDRFKR